MSKEQQPPEQHDQGREKERANSKPVAEIISDVLFRWRKLILFSVLAIVVIATAWGIYASVSYRQSQQATTVVYDLRKSFTNWKEAHPQDLLTASQNLKEQGEEELDLDEETQKKAEETEQDLKKKIQESISAPNKNVQAWGYWIEAQKARYLKKPEELQDALENLIALDDKLFHKLAKLHLASVLYSEGKDDQAVATWKELADISGPEATQLAASVYLGNYFARKGQKEDAIHYWELVQSLGEEMLQMHGLSDEESFLGGENLITGSFRGMLKQWKAMAENQLLFLQSEKIQVAADSYDASVSVKSQEAAPTASEIPKSVSFGTNSTLPGLDFSATNAAGDQ